MPTVTTAFFIYRFIFCILALKNFVLTTECNEMNNLLPVSTRERTHFEDSTYSESLFESNSTNQTLSHLESATPCALLNSTGLMDTDTDASLARFNKEQSALISKDVYETFKAVVWLGLVPTSSLIGIAGNSLGVWFVVHRKLKQPFHVILLCLMAVDLLYLVIGLLPYVLAIMEHLNKPMADNFHCYATRYIQLSQSITYGTCVYLITALSFERLLNILFPLKIKVCSLRKYTLFIVLFIFLMNTVVMVPAFFMLEPKETRDSKTNISSCRSVPTDWAKGNNHFIKYYTVIIFATVKILPGVITAVSNVIILIFLAIYRKRRAGRLANTTSGGWYLNQLKTTLVLVGLSLFLVTSLIPSAIATILSRYYPHLYGQGGVNYYTYKFAIDLAFSLRVINAANDFFIYIVLIKSSRKIVTQMLLAKCCHC